MKKGEFERVKEKYFLDGHVIKWRGFGVDDDGNVLAYFIVLDEDGNIIVNFSVPRSDIKRREDVVYAAKRSLGFFPDDDERPSISITRAESRSSEAD